MDWGEFGQILVTVLVSVAGGGAVLVALSKWIAALSAKTYVERVKHGLRQETESYRTKLRKSEFLCQKEFEAASEFMELRRRLMPRMRHPDMDWGEVYEDFAAKFDDVEVALERYLSAHGASLPDDLLEMIQSAFYEAEAGKFEDAEFGPGRSIAERILKTLEKVEGELRRAVRAQSST